MPSFGRGRAFRRGGASRAPHLSLNAGRSRLLGVAVLLAASLAACFDSRRIIFTNEANLPDAGGAGDAPPASQSQAARAEPAAVSRDGNPSSTDPGTLQAMALGADDGVPLDAGMAPSAADAGALDAAP
jgi:hypothetical protein